MSLSKAAVGNVIEAAARNANIVRRLTDSQAADIADLVQRARTGGTTGPPRFPAVPGGTAGDATGDIVTDFIDAARLAVDDAGDDAIANLKQMATKLEEAAAASLGNGRNLNGTGTNPPQHITNDAGTYGEPGATPQGSQISARAAYTPDGMLGNIVKRDSNGKLVTVAGLGAASFVAYLSFMMIGTHNCTVEVTNITPIRNSSGDLTGFKVTYDPDTVILADEITRGTGDCFQPTISDAFRFTDATPKSCIDDPGKEGMWYTIQKIEGDTLHINITPGTNYNKFPNGVNSPCIRSSTRTQGRIQIKTSFRNQFLGGIRSLVTTAIEIAEQVLRFAIDTADAAARAAGAAGGRAFCSLFPILCNPVLWISLLVLIVGGILFSVVKSRKGQVT